MGVGVVLIALGSVWAGEQRGYLVVTGKECLKVDLSKVELWVPMVDGRPDKAHSEIRHIFATYDPNCGVYRVEKINTR